MSDCWPEQDVIDKWLGSLDLPFKIEFATVMELKKAVTNIRTSQTEQFRTDNAAQAQEIDELKAHVNALREASKLFASSSSNVQDDCVIVFERDLDNLDAVIAKTPAQSLADHDAGVEEDVIERCATLSIAHCGNDAGERIAKAIRNLPRKYNV